MIEQIAIIAFGALSVWLANDPRDGWRKWACIFGLSAQPFWFYATWKAGQWGIFGITFVYAFAWARGFRYQWLAKRSASGN